LSAPRRELRPDCIRPCRFCAMPARAFQRGASCLPSACLASGPARHRPGACPHGQEGQP
jgi:hypothetical protein